MKPLKSYAELNLRAVMYVVIFLLFGSWFPVVLAGSVLIYRTADHGGVIATLLLFFFGVPTFFLMRGTFRMMRDEVRFTRSLKGMVPDQVVSASIDAYTTLLTGLMGGERIEFIVVIEPSHLANRKFRSRALSIAGWRVPKASVNEFRGELFLKNEKPFLFQSGELRVWIDDRPISARTEMAMGRALERLAEKVETVRQNGRQNKRN